MSDAELERLSAARLARANSRVVYPISGYPLALRRVDRRKAGGDRRSNSGAGLDPGRDHRDTGGAQMSFRERFAHEIHKVYEELLRTPPAVLLVLTCLAVLLVGAILVGASRP
jgi:hypothetical protein